MAGWLPLVNIGAGVPVLTFRGIIESTGGGSSISGSINIGTATADRLVVVASEHDNTGETLSGSVTAAGVTLTQAAFQNANSACGIWSALVTSGSGLQTVTVPWTGGGGSQNRNMSVWTMTGLASNTVKNSSAVGGGNASLPTTAGDLLVAISRGLSSTQDWHLSTETLTARTPSSPGPNLGGDLTVASTHATFTCAPNFPGGPIATAAATYR